MPGTNHQHHRHRHRHPHRPPPLPFRNSLSSLPADLADLALLQRLDAGGNPLAALPEGLLGGRDGEEVPAALQVRAREGNREGP
jgi:hypothetical protein